MRKGKKGAKKSGHKHSSLEKIMLATAIAQLIGAIIDLITRLLE